MSSDLKYEVFEQELLNPLRGHKLTECEAFVANLLLDASSHRPVKIRDIRLALERKGLTALSVRRVRKIVRTLRKEHAFPILARRSEPAGFWWCASAAEMDSFVKVFRSQAMDELHTLSRIVKQNYPALAGQLRLEEMHEQH